MKWIVEFQRDFEAEFDAMASDLQDELLSHVMVLQEFGPALGRPKVDTLYSSEYNNMKELRFDFNSGVWRIAFVFDYQRKAVLLIAGDKAGKNGKRFYKQLIKTADARFAKHLYNLDGN